MKARLLRLSVRNLLVGLLIVITVLRSDYDTTDPVERVRRYTRWQEFDYVTWTIDALFLKQSFAALDATRYLDLEAQRAVVLDYLDLVADQNRVRSQINTIYADPNITDPNTAAADLLALQHQIERQLQRQAPLAEAVIQHQVSTVIADIGLGLARQPVPPPLYHVTSLPRALIVSPRDVIRQDADVSLLPDISQDQIDRLEQEVETGLDVSALVVPIGGVGIYPTMVMSTTDLTWLTEVVAHEWIHNYLTMRPLGVLYYASPQLRIINETTASIAGKEIGQQVLARYYPEFLPEPAPPSQTVPAPDDEPPAAPEPEPFNFRAEMRETRVTVDALLADGKIEQAEAYMEARRRVFWDNGYRIRRLNQAYFSFYGAYADQPGGAAGEDPVSAAVRGLRAQSPNLAAFINRIAWVTSYESLARLVQP